MSHQKHHGLSTINVITWLLFITVIASIGLIIFNKHRASLPSHSVTSSGSQGTLKPQLAGLVDRHGVPTDLRYVPPISGVVIQIYWSDLQPTNAADLVTDRLQSNSPAGSDGALDTQLAQAQAHGLSVKLRVYTGRYAPKWLFTAAGSVHLVHINGLNNSDSADVPRFWSPTAMTAYQHLQVLLAAKYDSNPLIREVSISGPTTFFGEPFIREMNDGANAQTYLAAGYTESANQTAIKNAIADHAVWKQTRSALDVDPYQYLPNSKGKVTSDAGPSINIMLYCRQLLGKRCVLGNNGLNDQARGSQTQAVFNWIRDVGKAPIYFQTKQSGLYNHIDSVLSTGISYGAAMIELPVNYPNAPTTSGVPTNASFYVPFADQLKKQAANP